MELKIYIDRIKDGQTDVFSGVVSTSSLLLNEPGLTFEEELHVSGKAYLAGDHVLLQLHAKTAAWVLCPICNQPTKISLELPNFYHTEPLEDIHSGILDFAHILREDLLLEIPHFSECSGGECPERSELQKYMKKSNNSPFQNAQFPFSQL